MSLNENLLNEQMNEMISGNRGNFCGIPQAHRKQLHSPLLPLCPCTEKPLIRGQSWGKSRKDCWARKTSQV
jgi:hypothetical protein